MSIQYVNCCRCGASWPKPEPGQGGRGWASRWANGWFCPDSRECTLRLKRKRAWQERRRLTGPVRFADDRSES